MSTHVVMSTLKRSCRYGEVAALCSAWIGPPPKALPALPQHSCCYVSHNFRSPGDDTMTACATSRARHHSQHRRSSDTMAEAGTAPECSKAEEETLTLVKKVSRVGGDCWLR